jgi:selenocysteine-specific elongation factor
MTIVGTAGHVDHGKTTLVAALTGVDTDRLPEEKRRGITIELGFAPLPLVVDGEARTVSLVDVPGHERFVGTMVAGAQGIDLALLVVAADEGVMPQTREHLAILRAIGVDVFVVALTRCDLADRDLRALVRDEVESLFASEPTRAARRAPAIVEVSAKTGEGIDALRVALGVAVAECERGASASRSALPARLAVDRVFVPRGQGVVISGSLVTGRIAVDDEVTLLPEGRTARVRSLGVHGVAVTRATASTRLALGLAGIDRDEIERGAVVVAKGSLLAARAVDVVLHRTAKGRPIGRRTRLRLHLGTREITVRAIPLAQLDRDGGVRATVEDEAARGAMAAAHERWVVRLVSRDLIAAAPGDRGVLRADAAVAGEGTMFAGVEVLRVGPGRVGADRRGYASRWSQLPATEDAERALAEIESAGLRGLDRGALGPRLVARRVEAPVARVLTSLAVQEPGGATRWVASGVRRAAGERLVAAVRAFHAAAPDEEGPTLALALAAVPANAAPGLANALLTDLVGAGTLVRSGDRVRLASFVASVSTASGPAMALEAALEEARLTPPTLTELAATLQLDLARARALASALARERRVVHVQGDIWFARAPIDAMIERVTAALRERGSLNTAELKELLGVSRKYLVPIAEWLDAQRITLRVGDSRKLRALG